MDLEDRIAKIIKDEYAGTGFEDEGRSTAAAHDIINLLREFGFLTIPVPHEPA